MSNIQIRKATRKQAKLRVGVSGPAGSGKTYSALLLAKGIATDWDKIILIDTENGSGELYSDLGDYNIITLSAPYSPERYIEAIKACEQAGMEVIIIDSTSHEWEGSGGCLEINENLANSKFKGNTWAAWSETTPRHQKFIQAIVTSQCHVITTARSKIDMVQGDDKKVKKVGMKEIQREGFEYELTVNFTLDRDKHMAIASKDRTKLFIDRDPFIITTETGKELQEWNSGGVVDVNEQKRQIVFQMKYRLGIEMPEKADMADFVKSAVPKLTGMEYDENQLQNIIEALAFIEDKEWAQKTAWESPADTPATVPPTADDEPKEESPENVPTTLSASLEAKSYKELQDKCKEIGVPANGTKQELVERLTKELS